MARTSSPPPLRVSFYGPYLELLGVRAGGWISRFEDCMLASAEARDLEESLFDIEASISDLVGASEGGGMEGKTLDFRPSQMTPGMLKKLEEKGCFPVSRGLLSRGETTPKPTMNCAVVRTSSPMTFGSHLSGLSKRC